MGRKRLSKWYSIVFYFTISLTGIIFLSSCQGSKLHMSFNQPIYEAEFQNIEKVLNAVDQENYEAALAEAEKIERRYNDSDNISDDYFRVIMISIRMNTKLLRKVIQDKNNQLTQSQTIEQLHLMKKELNAKLGKSKIKLDQSNTKLSKSNIKLSKSKTKIGNSNTKIDNLTQQLRDMNTVFKTIERLQAENKILKQQIEDFKKIDLQSDKTEVVK
jgi:hypothetical protein